ncbi:MgtC/SapB family protein [soil metagenome]
MEPYETHLGLLTALAVGLLVGLEREQTKTDRGGGGLGGIRTYPLVALAGGIATLLGTVSIVIPMVALAGLLALIVVSYANDVKRTQAEGGHGITTEVSLVVIYLLGSLACTRGIVDPVETRLVLVAALGVATTFLLSSKPMFHQLAGKISHDDFYATVKFLIVAVIVLPLLPDRDMGPLRALNPRDLGLMVVIISGLSFLGYVAIKLWGAKRGLLVGAALGGLVSSTATTLSFSRRAQTAPELAPVAAGAISVAWAVMLGRVAVLVGIIDPPLLETLAIPLAAMLVATLIAMAITFRSSESSDMKIPLSNPFELSSAIKVTLVFAAVQIIIKAAIEYLGERGLYIAAGLSGTTDVDAVTVSTARLARDHLAAHAAMLAIVIAVGANTVVKAGLAFGIGGKRIGARMLVVAAAILLAGGVATAGILLT